MYRKKKYIYIYKYIYIFLFFTCPPWQISNSVTLLKRILKLPLNMTHVTVIYSWAEWKVIGCISIYFVCKMSWAWVFFQQTTQFSIDKWPCVIKPEMIEKSEAWNVLRDCMGLKSISCRKILWILKYKSFRVVTMDHKDNFT